MIFNGTVRNDELIGTAGDDMLNGLDGDDLINGRAGNDSLNGGIGDNILNGGAGNDSIIFGIGANTVDGGDGNDTLTLNFTNQTNDIVLTYNLSDDPSPTVGGILDGTTITSIEQAEIITGSGNDLVDIATATLPSSIVAGAGDDTMIGGQGNDSLEGNAGSDTFFGNSGDDEIIGGVGNDAAVYSGIGSDYEIILGEDSVTITGGPSNIEIPVEGGEDGETTVVPLDESFTDTLTGIEIILFDNGELNGEVIVATGEYRPIGEGDLDFTTAPTIIDESDFQLGENDIPVYQFIRSDNQTQFYTTDENERDVILDTLPVYELQGISFVGVTPPLEGEEGITGTSPIYRFFNRSTGIHLYTVDENERAFVEENLENFEFEGIPYYGYDTQVEGTVPLYRFYNQSLDAHFYTSSVNERESFIASPDFELEGGGDGVAFFVEPSNIAF